jgi:hypothetical protein
VVLWDEAPCYIIGMYQFLGKTFSITYTRITQLFKTVIIDSLLKYYGFVGREANPEDGRGGILRHVSSYLPDFTASHSRRP